MKRRRASRSEGLKSLEILISKALPDQFSVYEKMKKLVENWDKVVGPSLAKYSAPLEILEGELVVVAENPLVGKKLSMMGGNIARALKEHWMLDIAKTKVITGRLPTQRVSLSGKSRPPEVKVKEEEVTELKTQYAASLPEDAAESLARLRLFFHKRFRK